MHHCQQSALRRQEDPAGYVKVQEPRESNWGSYRPAHAGMYGTRQWTELRARVLKEQPTCYVEGCTARATEVDHIIAVHRREDLAYERSNVRGVCSEHHRQRTSQQGGEAVRIQKPATIVLASPKGPSLTVRFPRKT